MCPQILGPPKFLILCYKSWKFWKLAWHVSITVVTMGSDDPPQGVVFKLEDISYCHIGFIEKIKFLVIQAIK